MKTRILDISPSVAYEGVGHAGGKVQFYYLKKLEKDCDITFISTLEEDDKINFEKGKINGEYHILNRYKGFRTKFDFFRKLLIRFQLVNLFDRYQGLLPFDFKHHILAKVKELKKNGYSPDIVILEWTDISFIIREIKKYFPNAKYICHEVDVTFLRYSRKYEHANTFYKKIIHRIEYKRVRRKELKCLLQSDKVLVLNEKDKKLLTDCSFPETKIKIITPYFDTYYNVTRNINSKTIIFYGAMVRPENCEACEWFINNVFNKLSGDYKFIIIGFKPLKQILKYQSERIQVTGFVEDVSVYFSKCLCLVAPLINGAGIKIKILEAMSSEIPVLTNDVGIEGIPAVDGKDYLFCDTAEDYIKNIEKLSEDMEYALEMGKSARKFIKEKFSYENFSYLGD